MKKISLKNVRDTLSRKEMRVIAGGYSNGECIAACGYCDKGSECCSTVCAEDVPGCGGGKRCIK